MDILHLLASLLLLGKVHGDDWGYDKDKGPSHWMEEFPDCSGSHQSPVDIPALKDLQYQEMDRFVLEGFSNSSAYQLSLMNNGHTAGQEKAKHLLSAVQLNIKGTGNDVFVSGGGLPAKYYPAQLHFHWGSTNSKGSEHLYDGKAFPMEMHVVTYNSKYQNIKEAINMTDGLAVLGFWFQLSESDNEALDPITEALDDVQYEDDTININATVLSAIMRVDLSRFIRYHGSLTTPSCFESVTWTLFDDKIPVSLSQLSEFRKLLSNEAGETSHNMVNNFRPPQALNDRKILRSFQLTTDGSTPLNGSGLLLAIVLVTWCVLSHS